MSTLLKEAIVDAKALRDAALKNAETSIIEKYSDEVRQTLDSLLEQDELDLGLGAEGEEDIPAIDPMAMEEGEEAPAEDIVDGVPLAATDGLAENEGEDLQYLEEEDEEVKVSVDLDALQEAVAKLRTEDTDTDDDIYEEEKELNEEDIIAMLSEDDEEDEVAGEAAESTEGSKDDSAAKAEAEAAEFSDKPSGLGEEIEASEELLDSIVEKLTVDMGAELSGWAGRSDFDLRWEIEKEMAHRRSTDVEEELKDLKKAQEELVFENKQLKEQTKKFKQAAGELKGILQETNISNARLLYTNRVLRNTSLNERQKEMIAEAISKAGSVLEAKTIYDTLESATPAHSKRAPQSLSEAITRPSSVIRASRREAQTTDPFLDRMRKLAGIKH